MKPKKTLYSQSNLRKKNKTGGIIIPNLKLYNKVIAIKTVWHWLKSRHINQQDRMENSTINPGMYDQLIYNTGAENIQWGKNSLLTK